MADAAIAVMVVAVLACGCFGLWLVSNRPPRPAPARRMTRREAKVERYKADLDAKVRMAEAEARKWEAVRKTVETDGND